MKRQLLIYHELKVSFCQLLQPPIHCNQFTLIYQHQPY
jgi:hypothetical protein